MHFFLLAELRETSQWYHMNARVDVDGWILLPLLYYVRMRRGVCAILRLPRHFGGVIPEGTMRLERFTDKAQEAFQEAQDIMHAQHHTQLDVEHIFLAMLQQRDGLTARTLERLGVDAETISQRVERELEKSPKVYGQYGYGNQVYITPRTQRLVKRAEEEAARLNDQHVG